MWSFARCRRERLEGILLTGGSTAVGRGSGEARRMLSMRWGGNLRKSLAEDEARQTGSCKGGTVCVRLRCLELIPKATGAIERGFKWGAP